jgi:hypothetical protein
MSKEGINLVAEVFILMQRNRDELLKMGTKQGKLDKQDIKLGQLLETGKDAMKWRFAEITTEKDK